MGRWVVKIGWCVGDNPPLGLIFFLLLVLQLNLIIVCSILVCELAGVF
jgi:hypothetical protein